MNRTILVPIVLALALGVAGLADAQTTTPTGPAATPSTAPTTAPTTTGPSTTGSGTMAPSTTSNAPVVSGTGSATNNSGAPVAGANSFTEGQARDRIQDRGYTQVSDLKLDAQGIWRAKASRNGQSMDVSLDYQGNVVPQ